MYIDVGLSTATRTFQVHWHTAHGMELCRCNQIKVSTFVRQQKEKAIENKPLTQTPALHLLMQGAIACLYACAHSDNEKYLSYSKIPR